MRFIYKLLSLWWQARAARRGPGAWARQRGRSHAHRALARGLRRTFLAPRRGGR